MPNAIQRSLWIDDALYTISNRQIAGLHDLEDLVELKRVELSRSASIPYIYPLGNNLCRFLHAPSIKELFELFTNFRPLNLREAEIHLCSKTRSNEQSSSDPCVYLPEVSWESRRTKRSQNKRPFGSPAFCSAMGYSASRIRTTLSALCSIFQHRANELSIWCFC